MKLLALLLLIAVPSTLLAEGDTSYNNFLSDPMAASGGTTPPSQSAAGARPMTNTSAFATTYDSFAGNTPEAEHKQEVIKAIQAWYQGCVAKRGEEICNLAMQQVGASAGFAALPGGQPAGAPEQDSNAMLMQLLPLLLGQGQQQ